MGTTCAAVHLIHAGSAASAQDAVATTYAGLGWRAGTEATRTAALVENGSGRFLTVVDSACEQVDDGTLKYLAVALSAAPGHIAVVTSLHDSDSFELILFIGGKQVDAILDEGHGSARLQRLDAEARARLFATHFPDAPASLPEPSASVFAEDRLAVWCRTIGLDPANTLLRLAELPADRIEAVLSLERGPLPTLETRPSPILQPFHDDDDCPHHRVFPAAWPVPITRPFGAKWIVLSCHGGFDGLRVELDVSETRGTTLLNRIRIEAYPFYNGQITSPTPIASDCIAVEAPLVDGLRKITLPGFTIPDIDPEARKRIAILVWPEFRANQGSRVRLDLYLTPMAEGAVRERFAPMRLAAPALDWCPYGVDRGVTEIMKERSLLLLNQPSVLSCIAILPRDDEAVRGDIQGQVEDWLTGLTAAAGARAVLRSEKHMTASGSVAKNKAEARLDAITQEKLWRRAFLLKSAMQTVSLEITPPGAFLPEAGFLLQTPLREEMPDMVDAPSVPHVAFWMINHPDAWSALGTTPEDLETRFRAWMGACQPLQAGILRTAWIPMFDRYSEYVETPLEELSSTDWFQEGKRGQLMQQSWCARHLRFLAREMWLDEEMIEGRFDGDALAAIARLDRIGSLTHLVLERAASLADLEAALSPLLP
ncbi:MAG: hypothetical protein AAGF76_14770 [Pseudomonadota bacterium]